jgi:hypothetical protein
MRIYTLRGIEKTGKVQPITGAEEPEGEQRCLYFFFNLGARWGWVVNATYTTVLPLPPFIPDDRVTTVLPL